MASTALATPLQPQENLRSGRYIEFPDNSSVWFSNGNKKSYFHSFAKKYI